MIPLRENIVFKHFEGKGEGRVHRFCECFDNFFYCTLCVKQMLYNVITGLPYIQRQKSDERRQR